MVSEIKRVAVIGAGVSGLSAAKHLKFSGFELVVYERSSTAGGIWSYDERQPLDPAYPSVKPSIADFVVDQKGDVEVKVTETHEEDNERLGEQKITDAELKHAPPGPAYDGLTNNISTVLQEMKDHPWKDGTDDFVNVRAVGDYLQGFSKAFEVQPLIKFNTRVEGLEKIGGKWQLISSALVLLGSQKGEKIKCMEEFDAVVVASGHYHAARVPDIPGLAEWKSAWPERVQHSKRYRRPQGFAGQNVLLIGAGVSSMDIAREISPLATKIYQSSRNGAWDIPVSFLPINTVRVAEISAFSSPSQGRPYVTLADGTVLTDVDRVVICTGYHISYPFLSHMHADDTAPEDADENVLVTDGTMVHNLHKDIFYIPDPTLTFVGTSYYIATFTLFEFQAIAVAGVFSGKAVLPTPDEMRREYKEKVAQKGTGREFHSLKNEEKEYVRTLVEWLNERGVGELVEGHSKRWLEEEKLRMVKIKKMFEVKEANLNLEIENRPWRDFETRGENPVEA